MCFNELVVVEFVGQRREVVVEVRFWFHGVKRGGDKCVRGEDERHKQILVTVELSFVLCKNATLVQLLVHVCEVE